MTLDINWQNNVAGATAINQTNLRQLLVAAAKAGTISDADFLFPTDGDIAVNTSLGELVFRSGGSWLSASALNRGFTYVVAPSNSRDHAASHVDLVLNGTNDETGLDTAKAAILAAGGGSLVILDGTVNLSRCWTFDVNGGSLWFAGSTMALSAAQANQPVLRIGNDSIEVFNPKITGSGTRGNGIGIVLQRTTSLPTVHLAGNITNASTSFTLTNGSSAGLAQGDEIEIGTEWIKLTTAAPSGSDLVVSVATRGNQGTTAASHTTGDAVTQLGGVHGVDVYAPRISNCNAGVEFGIGGGSSSGDNTVYNPDISACKTGVRSKGFTNTMWGGYIRTCDYGVKVTADRPDSTMICYGTTILSWSKNAVWVQRGHQSIFDSCWLEQSSSASGTAMVEVVRIGMDGTETPDANDGQTSVSARQVVDCRFTGRTFISPGKDATNCEDYLFRLVNSQGLLVESLMLSTNGPKNGGLPDTALIREDANNSGTLNVFERILIGPGSTPSGFTGMSTTIDKAGTGQVIIQELPLPGGASGASFGREILPPSEYTYSVGYKGTAYSDGSPGVAPGRVYYALDRNGHIAWWAQDKNYVIASGTNLPTMQGANLTPPVGVLFKTSDSGLQTVLDNLIADHVGFFFPLSKYDFGYGCGVKHHRWSGVSYVGAGRDSTAILNYTVGTQDIEPLSFEDMDHLTVSDLTLVGGGNHPVSTGTLSSFDSCDAFDSDHMTYGVIERVRVIASRDRGFVTDGKDIGQSGLNNGQTTLNGGIASGDTVIALAGGTTDFPGFPATSGFQGTMPDQVPFIASIGHATLNGDQALNGGTINVNSVTDVWPASGSFMYGPYRISYTGKTTGGGNVTAFTGCTGGPAGVTGKTGTTIFGEFVEVGAVDAANNKFYNVARGRNGSSAQAWLTAARVYRVFFAKHNVFRDCEVEGAQPVAPSAAPTATPSASGGHIADGTYKYAVAYVYNDYRESSISPLTSNAVVSGGAGAGSIALTAIPTGGTGVIMRKIYRTLAGPGTDLYLVRTLYNNTQTSYTDTAPDVNGGGFQGISSTSVNTTNQPNATFDGFCSPAGGVSGATSGSTIFTHGLEILAGNDNEIDNCRFFRCGGYGWRLTGTGSSASQPGDQCFKGANRNRVKGGASESNLSYGGRIEGQADMNEVLGWTCLSNNANGLYIISYRTGTTDAVSSKRHIIQGCIITDPMASAQQVQTNGIKFDATNGDITDVMVSGNQLQGNKTNAVSITGTLTTPLFRNNKGYTTEAGGTSTQTPGAVATVTITTGLSTPPTMYNVTPADANARGAPTFHVTVSGNNIVLNFSANLTAATAYTWAWTASA